MKLDWNRPQGDAWKAYESTVVAATVFGRNAAPLAFTWLGWCALLATIRYVEIQAGLWPATALKWILGFLLWAYFVTFLSAEDNVVWRSREELLARSAWMRVLISFTGTLGLLFASHLFADVLMKYPL